MREAGEKQTDTLRVALYARVSTADKDQNPETQILPLREFVLAQGWTVAGEYVDHAPATDLRGRTAWREMLERAARRRVDLVLVWRIDRAFRSVHEAANTLERLRAWNVGLRSYSEPWLDTTSPFGEALYYITVAYAQLERGIISERVRAGMHRARAPGEASGPSAGRERGVGQGPAPDRERHDEPTEGGAGPRDRPEYRLPADGPKGGWKRTP